MDTKRIFTLYQKALEELNQFRPMMNNIYAHVIPNRNTWRGQMVIPGQRTDLQIFNDYPMLATKQWSAQLVSLIMPAGSKFFKIKPIDSEKKLINESSNIESQLEGISDSILEILNSTNFYQAVTESFVDLAAGTAGIIINFDDATDTLYFTSLDMAQVSFLEDHTGRINYVFRGFDNIDEESQKLLFPNIDFGNNCVDLLECVVPYTSTDKKNSKMKFRYILTDTSCSKIYYEALSETNPFIIFRWSKRSGENRGRGILTDIIGTIMMTNAMARDVMDAASLVISPPIIAKSSSILNPNNIRIMPNAVITLKDGDGIKPFPVTPNLPFGMEAINQNNGLVDKAYMTNQLGVVGAQNLTATEVNARLQLAANVYGAAYNRLQREMLNPAFSRIIELLEKRGIIKPVTIDTESGNEMKIKLTYSSPIIDASKTIEAQKLGMAMQFTLQTTGDTRLIPASYKVEDIGRYAAGAFGARMDLVRTKDECDKILDEIKEAKLQQQQALTNPAFQSPVNTGVFPGA